jgi:hypothetical protein
LHTDTVQGGLSYAGGAAMADVFLDAAIALDEESGFGRRA